VGNGLKNRPLNRAQYDTWFAFKKDLELMLWCHIDNSLWLKIKPKKALPWHESDMKATLSRMLDI
jgi:hypothetical protein